MTQSPFAELGHGSVISGYCLWKPFLVSRFMCALLSVPRHCRSASIAGGCTGLRTVMSLSPILVARGSGCARMRRISTASWIATRIPNHGCQWKNDHDERSKPCCTTTSDRTALSTAKPQTSISRSAEPTSAPRLIFLEPGQVIANLCRRASFAAWLRQALIQRSAAVGIASVWR
jgi:hypothetical protein